MSLLPVKNKETDYVIWKTKLYGPFLWMGFKCLKDTESLQEDTLLFTTQSSEVPGTHLIEFRRMKGWVKLGATQRF